MNRAEAARLLVRVSAVDRREVTDLMVVAWEEVLAEVPYEAAVDALVAHRREEPGVWVEPGHLAQRAGAALSRDFRADSVSEDRRLVFEALGGAQSAWPVDAIDQELAIRGLYEERAMRALEEKKDEEQ